MISNEQTSIGVLVGARRLRRRRGWAGFRWLASVLAAPLVVAAAEKPPVLRASEILPSELRSGPGFSVDELVPTDGFQGTFTIRSKSGSLTVRGMDMLRVRAAEFAALEQLESVGRVEAMTAGVKETAAESRGAVRQTLEDPVGTVAHIPQGVGGLFKRAGQKVGGAGKAVSSKVSGGEGGGTAKSQGDNEARRAWAKKLGVDPYTTNPLLSKRLDELARAARVGDLAVGIATGGASRLVGLGAAVIDESCDLSAADLKARNQQRLAAMGVSVPAAHGLFTNRWWTPTSQTALTTSLESCEGVGGREEWVKLAGNARSYDETHFVFLAAKLLAGLHRRTAAIERLDVLGRLPVAYSREGGLVVPGPIDYLSNVELVSDFARRNDLPGGKRDLFLTGQISPQAREAFTQAGWTIHTQFVP